MALNLDSLQGMPKYALLHKCLTHLAPENVTSDADKMTGTQIL